MSVPPSGKAMEEAAAVEKSWYTPARPAPSRGWFVYSLDFVLATLQGCMADPSRVRRTPLRLAVGWIVLALMGVGQVVVMALASIPILSWFVETGCRVFTRNGMGFFLRACYWKTKLKSLGQNTIIDQYVEIWGAKNVSIGSHCHIDTNVRLGAGERSQGQHGSIEIGDFVHLGPGVHIAGRGGVKIGDFVGVSANAHLYSATGVVLRPEDPGQLISMSHMAPSDQQHVYEAPIEIGEYAFIGIMARIMPGVTVGRGAIVHANAEVTRSIPAFANFGGVSGGRQIGWRRPRRRSPHLQSDEQTDSSGHSAGQGGSSHA